MSRQVVCRPTLERMWFIDGQLRDGMPVVISKTAHELEVSEKTIRRDLDFLRDRLRYDLCYNPAANGWVFRGLPPKARI